MEERLREVEGIREKTWSKDYKLRDTSNAVIPIDNVIIVARFCSPIPTCHGPESRAGRGCLFHDWQLELLDRPFVSCVPTRTSWRGVRGVIRAVAGQCFVGLLASCWVWWIVVGCGQPCCSCDVLRTTPRQSAPPSVNNMHNYFKMSTLSVLISLLQVIDNELHNILNNQSHRIKR